jgi:hypothetical protein
MEYVVHLVELITDASGSRANGETVHYISSKTKKAAINAAIKGVKRPDILSAWIYEESENDYPYKAYIYKGDKQITDTTHC